MAKKRRLKPAVKQKRRKRQKKSWWFLLIPVGIGFYFFFWYKSETFVPNPHQFYKTVPKGYKSIGIDVSHHQGEIDWDYLFLEKGFDTIIDFVYCKVSEGTDHEDRQWKRNREYLNKHGISNGVYHYFSPKTDPVAQATHFLSLYQIRSIDLPPALDVEDEGYSDEDLTEAVLTWCETVRKKTGIRPIIYTSLHFYETKFRGKIHGYNFWIAAYSREPQYISDKEVLHWQFSETGRLPGIKGNVDLNVSKIDIY